MTSDAGMRIIAGGGGCVQRFHGLQSRKHFLVNSSSNIITINPQLNACVKCTCVCAVCVSGNDTVQIGK